MIVNSIAMNIENIPLYSTILLIHKAPSEITNKNIFLGWFFVIVCFIFIWRMVRNQIETAKNMLIFYIWH